MSHLDGLFGIRALFRAGSELVTRRALDFVGDGWTVVDNPATGRTEVQHSGVGGTPANGVQYTSLTDPQIVGVFEMAPTASLITCRACLWATSGMTAELTLTNLTDGTEVSAATLTTTSTVPVVQEFELELGVDVPASRKLYALNLRISSGTPGPGARAFLGFFRAVGAVK